MPNKITLYANQKVDYLIITSQIPTQREIDHLLTPDVVPLWSTLKNSEIFCPFTDNIVSTYIDGLISPLEKWSIYRQKKGDNRIYQVANVDKNTLYVVDYMVANATEYRWEVVPITETAVGVSLKSEYTKTDWWNYSLTGLAEISPDVFVASDVWTFDVNLTTQENKQILDRTKFQNYTRYPKFSVGKTNYMESGLRCYLGGINCLTFKYEEPLELMKKWQDFVSKNQQCLLKDRAGNIRRVFIEDHTFKTQDTISEQPNEISFSWSEIGDTDVSVYGYE